MTIFRPRLTPTLIFCASLLLTVKVAGVWHGVVVITGAQRAHAQAAPQEAAKPAEPAPAKQASAAPAAAPPSGADLDVLQNLALRRDELDKRAADLDMREKLLMATEERVKKRVDELKKIEASINAMITQQDAQKVKEMAKLVKVYETMKPKDAAQIFNTLDPVTLLNVATLMNADKLAPVLAAMGATDAKKATELTVELATHKTVPDSPPEGIIDAPPMPAKAAAPAPAAMPTAQPAKTPDLLKPLPAGSAARPANG